MSRYTQTTKSKYHITEAVYGTYDKAVVDAGIADGTFLLFEREVHAKIDGRMVAYPDRRFMPASERVKQEKKGWSVVAMSGAEVASSAPVTKREKKQQ